MNDDLSIEKERICGFHQLYNNKVMEKHKYTGKAYKCLKCKEVGCFYCLNKKDLELYSSDNIYICSPCYYREQLKININQVSAKIQLKKNFKNNQSSQISNM